MLTLQPMNAGKLTITVSDESDVLWAQGSGTADVYLPSGQLVAGDVPVVFVGLGVLEMTIDASWSEGPDQLGLEGLYIAMFTVTNGVHTVVDRVPYFCLWEG